MKIDESQQKIFPGKWELFYGTKTKLWPRNQSPSINNKEIRKFSQEMIFSYVKITSQEIKIHLKTIIHQ